MHCLARIALVLLSAFAAATAAAAEPTKVMIVGTYHFGNPGRDIHNMKAADVLEPQRQAEIDAVIEALDRFAPTLVAVESSPARADQRYAAYRKGELNKDRNEIVQLGFRLAARRSLARVHGIDASGEFPFDRVQAWAEANGRGEALASANAEIGAMVQRLGAMQADHSIGQILAHMNQPAVIDQDQAFYINLLRFGAGDEQPGAELNAAWARRNYLICARLLQALAPGDRAVVIYGAGHSAHLRRCVQEAPGVDLVEAIDYLPPLRAAPVR